MQGVSGTYAINGTSLLLMPTEARWLERTSVGVSGDGHTTYANPRKFEMKWDLMDMASYSQLQGFFSPIQSTGTVIVDLPKYGVSPYTYYSYTGCTLQEPTFDKFYETYVEGVTLLILKIR